MKPPDTCARPRYALIQLKWNLVVAIGDGWTLEQVCAQLGHPWTPELLRQCFPDVMRKTEAA